MLAKLSPEQRLLLDAADVIRKNGHCKNALRDAAGRVCAIGAIMEAAREAYPGPNWSGFRDRVTDAFRLVEEVGGIPCIAAWNNAPERTADEVIAAFERVALMSVE